MESGRLVAGSGRSWRRQSHAHLLLLSTLWDALGDHTEATTVTHTPPTAQTREVRFRLSLMVGLVISLLGVHGFTANTRLIRIQETLARGGAVLPAEVHWLRAAIATMRTHTYGRSDG